MSATLYALVVLQGTTLTFSPGYTTAAECLQQYKGPYVSCFPYDPERTTWTAFFKTPGSGFGSIWNFPNESVCQSYVGALRPDVPAACRQLARPESCPVSCVAPVQPPAPTGSIPPKPPEVTPPPEPDPKPDPASIETKPSDIQVGGKQYTRVAGLSWIERATSRIYLLMFRWGRLSFRAKISPPPCRLRLRGLRRHKGGRVMHHSSMRSVHPSHSGRSSTW